jgi:hypothetical protein
MCDLTPHGGDVPAADSADALAALISRLDPAELAEMIEDAKTRMLNEHADVPVRAAAAMLMFALRERACGGSFDDVRRLLPVDSEPR